MANRTNVDLFFSITFALALGIYGAVEPSVAASGWLFIRLPDGEIAGDFPRGLAKIGARATDALIEISIAWRMLGKPMTRLDIKSKATGQIKFGIDMTMEGMVFASVKLNPNKGQALKSYDASKAQSMPGVKKVLEIKNGVAVIAPNSWYAMKGVEAVYCEWAPSTYPAEQADHWKKLETSFTPDFLGKEWRKIGDIDAGLKSGTLVEAEYRAPYVAHQPLEPLNGIGLFKDDGLELWLGHQSPQLVQNVAANAIGLKPQQVAFHNQWTGGSFGHRLEYENVRVLAEIARQMPGTPVKLIFSRKDDFRQDIPTTDCDRPELRQCRQEQDCGRRSEIGVDSTIERLAGAEPHPVERS